MAKALITKQVVTPGQKHIPMERGTRVTFHFETRRVTDRFLLDDSRKLRRPITLILGKNFRMEVWEILVQGMSLHEVARFTVDKSLVSDYPIVSQAIRSDRKRRPCCAKSAQREIAANKEIENLIRTPCDLEFTMEIMIIELPGEFRKPYWELTDADQLRKIAVLREKGNKLYRDKKYSAAEARYDQALIIIEQLMLKEKAQKDWSALADMKVPLLTNHALCRLIADDYYSVIEDCTEVLCFQPDNVKALFRRAKGHVGAWNPDDARNDFKRAAELDTSLQATVAKELKAIDEQQRIRDLEDKMRLQKLFTP